MPKVNIEITAKDDASSILRKVNQELLGIDKTAQKTNSIFSTKNVTIAATATAMYKLGTSALKASGEMEQNEIAFTTMLGSAGKAKDLLQDMTKFAESTPFELPGVVNAGKQMIAFGFQSNEIINNLRMLGDVSAGLSVPIGDMTYLFGQIKTQGKAMTQDLMQFANRGVPIFEELAKVTGKNTGEIRKMASQGKIGFDEIDMAFKNMTGAGSKFGGLMEAQSKSLLGQWSNLNDTFGETERIIGKELTPVASDLMTIASEGLKALNIMMSSELPDSITMTGSIIKDVKNLMNGTAEAVESIGDNLGEIKVDQILDEVRMWEASSTGISAKVDDLSTKYGKVNAYAGIYSEYVKGNVKLTDAQVKNMETILSQYKSIGVQAKDELESWKQRGMIKLETKEEKSTPKKDDDSANKEWANKKKQANSYYNDLVLKSAMAEASDIKRIDLTTQKELKSLDEKKAYLTEYQYQEAQSLITYDAIRQADQARMKETSAMFSDLSSIQTKFYTDSSSEAANAVGTMSATIVSSIQGMSSEISKVFADIAADSRKNGMSMGDGFKIGASVAVAALSSINAVLNMQSALVQASYQRQIEALQYKQEKEQEALEASYELLEEDSSNKEELRLLELQAYAESLQGKTDAEIDYALKKKETELKSANDANTLQKKKEADQKKIDQKYATEKWKLEVEAFNAKKDADKAAVMMSTSIGIVSAWAGAMQLSPVMPAVIAVGSALSAIMFGAAAKQINMIDGQKPPAPPKFATGVTNFEGGMAIVGERGREMVTLPRGANVITNENTESLLAGSPQYLVNNIYVNGVLTQQEIVDLRRASAYGGYN